MIIHSYNNKMIFCQFICMILFLIVLTYFLNECCQNIHNYNQIYILTHYLKVFGGFLNIYVLLTN